MAAFEEQEESSLFDDLAQAGVTLPAPDELDDPQLTAKLWEIIDALAVRRNFLHNTDHLSDRQLYAELWNDVLREPFVPISVPEHVGQGFFLIDMVGTGSEEHILLQLKHYADEEQRRIWLQDWPDEPMPDHEDPPYDRDRLLPQPESRKSGPTM
jgi:hypothetical protein